MTKKLSPRTDREAVQRLLRTARGQIDGVIKMIDDGKYCVNVAHQILATQAILRSVNRAILQGHLEGCVADAFADGTPEEQQEKIQEILDLMDFIGK